MVGDTTERVAAQLPTPKGLCWTLAGVGTKNCWFAVCYLLIDSNVASNQPKRKFPRSNGNSNENRIIHKISKDITNNTLLIELADLTDMDKFGLHCFFHSCQEH